MDAESTFELLTRLAQEVEVTGHQSSVADMALHPEGFDLACARIASGPTSVERLVALALSVGVNLGFRFGPSIAVRKLNHELHPSSLVLSALSVADVDDADFAYAVADRAGCLPADIEGFLDAKSLYSDAIADAIAWYFAEPGEQEHADFWKKLRDSYVLAVARRIGCGTYQMPDDDLMGA